MMNNEENKNNGKLFKLLGVGLDTTTIKYKPVDPHELSYDYIYTSLRANNDYIISDYVSQMPFSSLIVGVDFLDNEKDTLTTMLLNHISTLNRSKIDLLLIDSSCDFTKFKNDLDKTNELVVDEIGLKNPKTVDDIINAKKLLNNKLRYVALNLSPLEFNYDVVKWCDENKISILGFNPLGGNITAPAMINAFSVPYLLNFSANYSVITFLSGRDLYLSGESKKYLEKVIGEISSPKYVLKKNVNRIFKPIKKVISTSLKFGESVNISFDSPELLFDFSELEFSLGNKPIPDKMTIDEKYLSVEEKDVKLIFDTSYIPSDANELDLLAYYRYRILNLLKLTKYPKEFGWDLEVSRLSNNMITIKVERKNETRSWFKKKETKTVHYYFFGLLSGNTPFFCKFKNADQKF